MDVKNLDNVYLCLGDGFPVVTEGDVSVKFIVRCRVCHFGLCMYLTILKRKRTKQNVVFIEPCPNCVKAAENGKEVIPYEMNNDYYTREKFEYGTDNTKDY